MRVERKVWMDAQARDAGPQGDGPQRTSSAIRPAMPEARISAASREDFPLGVFLGIESSCDETAAAVVQDGHRVLGEAIQSSSAIQARYGGVVPEVAARQHVEVITMVIEEALSQSGMTGGELTGVGVTIGPGLLSALLVGMTAAKSLALAWRKPLIPVHHLEAHLYANALDGPIVHPSLALLVSGGHTGLWYWEAPDRLKLLGETRDDAAGEAFDKGARILGLPYPGGPAIQQLAASAIERTCRLPVARLSDKDSLDFSFSGLKTALSQAMGAGEPERAEWAWALQEAVAEAVLGRLEQAHRRYPVDHVYVAGGVTANGCLRDRLRAWSESFGVHLHVPPLRYCTDNGVMVAAAAAYGFQQGHRAALAIEPRTPYPLGTKTDAAPLNLGADH